MHRLSLIVICVFSFQWQCYAAGNQPYTEIEDRALLPLLTPDLSERNTLKLRLNNGLELYLISDPKSDKSGAVISVKTGSWEDPNEYPGIAHFLEHMLFLGTKKYPEEAGYHRFISQHGGLANAYTSNYYTSYMFSVDNAAFPEALDRFANFFKEPLFNPSGVARELQAIDQEYAKNLDDDNWRMLFVDKELANRDHPYFRFNIGNSSTLNKVSRSTLEKWYRDHYSANLMRVVAVSPLPLEQLKNIAVEAFEGVPNTDRLPFTIKDPALSRDTLGKMVYIEPVQNNRTIAILWELPTEFAKMKDSQPATVVCHVLGHEGEESLLAQLKREQLAEKLQCGKSRIGADHIEFYLEITLTDEGVQQVNRVIERTFEAITKLRRNGIPRYVFDELQRMATINYQYQSREDLFSYLMKEADYIVNADSLSLYPEQTFIIQKYDPTAISSLLNYLTPDHAHFYFMAPSSDTGVFSDRKEKWLGASYTVKPISPELLTRWAHAEPSAQIDSPAINPFIPQHLALVEGRQGINVSKENYKVPHPVRIVDDERGLIYFATDEYYNVPEVSLLMEIKTPLIDAGNCTKVVLTDLYVKSIVEALNRYSYPAAVAGLEYHVERGEYGLKLTVSGYSDNADLLFEEIVKQLKSVRPTEQEFEIYRASLQRDYNNFSKESPLDRAMETLRSAIFKKFTTHRQRGLAIRKVTYEQFNLFIDHLFDQTYLEGVFYGNLSKQEATSLSEKLFSTLDGKPYPKAKIKRPQVILLPEQQGPFYLETASKMQGNAVVLVVEYPIFDFKLRAAQQVLMQAMKEPFFSELRTRQQTGYLVSSDALEIEKQLFNLFAVQSNTHGVRDLLARFELFLEGYLQEIDEELPKERFELIRGALLNILQQPPKDVEQMGRLLQKLAFDYQGDFDRIAKRIRGFKELTYEETIARANSVMGRNNKRRLAVLLKGMLPKEKLFEYKPIKGVSALRRVSDYTDHQNDE